MAIYVALQAPWPAVDVALIARCNQVVVVRCDNPLDAVVY